ncbi:MAG: hypothetical protein JW795_02285 [Chitinivibrionales bacterium]|nr:hypothetical protein [Chitinivibrionales bacterium]
MNTHFFFIVMLMIVGFFGTVFPDIAPTEYSGYTLSPYHTTAVQLKSETVDIYWGDVCRVEADFELLNSTGKKIKLKIGFPTNITFIKSGARYDTDSVNAVYNFKFSLNNKILKESDIPKPVINSNHEDWYGWKCTLQPKENRIKISYAVLTNPSYDYRWFRNLHYVLYTGKFWAGPIGKAKVRIHFPEKIVPEQVLTITPAFNYSRDDTTITWTFSNFEPSMNHNIHLGIFDFKTFALLTTYKKMLHESSILTNAKKLEIASFFAGLAPSKGYDVSAPTHFNYTYYQQNVLSQLSPEELLVFDKTYEIQFDSDSNRFYRVKTIENFRHDFSIQETIKGVMKRIKHLEKVAYPRTYPLAQEAGRLFNEVIADAPDDCSAWRCYIEHLHLINGEAYNPCLPWHNWGSNGICQEQTTTITQAYAHCTDDTIIKSWYRFIDTAHYVLPDTIGKLDRSSSGLPYLDRIAGITMTVLIKDSDFSWHSSPLSERELETLASNYTIERNNYLVLDKKKTDLGKKNAIVQLLIRFHFFEGAFCRELKKS